MSDYQEREFVWESLISPSKRKRKKDSRKDRNLGKPKNCVSMKKDQSIQKKKKKKKSKFTEAMKVKKEKKKEKKEKKKSDGLDQSFLLTQGHSGVFGTFAKSKPELSHLESSEKIKPDDLTQELKKTKRRKKVAWDLSPGYFRVKRPQFASSSSKDNFPSEKEAVGEGESCSQVTTRAQPCDNDSQCTNDDINSQDLFITQKTFRLSPSEPSSGEASNIPPTPLTQQDRWLNSPGVQIKQCEGSNAHLQQSHLYQHPKKARGKSQRPNMEEIVVEEEERLNFAQQKKVSDPSRVETRVVNPYLDEPFVISPSLHAAKSKKTSCSSSQQSPSHLGNTGEPSLLLHMSKSNISTQTENFFTAELCSFLNFCQNRVASVYDECRKPLDLSLPQRARKDLLSAPEIVEEKLKSSLPNKLKDNGYKDPTGSSELKDVELREEHSGRQQTSLSAQVKGQTMPSPWSEFETKSVFVTSSSEDSEPPSCTSKTDLTQVRAVQMRLNESFFFKTKGEGKAVRPESPLMKLTQGRELKSRKGH